MTAQEPDRSISSGLVWPFVKIALQHRCDALLARCRAQLNVDPLQLEHSELRFPLQVVAPWLSELVARLGPQVGLVAAQHVATRHLGLAEFLARAKDTLGAAVISSIRYAYLLCDGAHRGMSIQADSARLRFWFDEDLAIHDAAHEFALALLLTCARRITQLPDLCPTEVHFTHPPPADLTLHEQHFRCVLRFNMPVSALVFPAQLLELPLPAAEPALSRLLDEHATLTLAGQPRVKLIIPQVRELLAAEIGTRRPTANRVAKRLGISPRTLARRLHAEQSSFQVLFDQTRRDRAVKELRETTRSINDIAKRLGFASSQSFHRAFRRWTGTTAMSFRGRAKRRSSLSAAPSQTLCPDVARMAGCSAPAVDDLELVPTY